MVDPTSFFGVFTILTTQSLDGGLKVVVVDLIRPLQSCFGNPRALKVSSVEKKRGEVPYRSIERDGSKVSTA